jgi:Ger(x)C family germination protein
MTKKIRINKYIIVLFCIIVFLIIFKPEKVFEPIEELAIPSAIGYDLRFNENNNPEYTVAFLLENYGSNDEVFSQTITATNINIPGTREIRQFKTNRKTLLGLERFIVYSEDFARYGIRNSLDTLFSYYTENDMPYIAVCNGKAADLFKYKVPGYPSMGDYMQGMVEHSKEYNFAPINYKVIDAYVRVDAEGRNFAAPYIEIKDNVLQITGMALFKGDRMVRKISREDAKTMNLLRENDVKGIISLQKSPKEYISCYVTSKRKAKCEKVDDKYIFTINLSLKAEVTSNTIDRNIFKNQLTVKEFENQLSRQLEKECHDFIKKMQSDYRVDCLELGWEAAAKYGRGTGIDWDEVVSNSEIKVNAKINVMETGRGNY